MLDFRIRTTANLVWCVRRGGRIRSPISCADVRAVVARNAIDLLLRHGTAQALRAAILFLTMARDPTRSAEYTSMKRDG